MGRDVAAQLEDDLGVAGQRDCAGVAVPTLPADEGEQRRP
jgi:hypothetical protein